jgi:hypothetical protein
MHAPGPCAHLSADLKLLVEASSRSSGGITESAATDVLVCTLHAAGLEVMDWLLCFSLTKRGDGLAVVCFTDEPVRLAGG